jgi:hypothetical protein
MCAVTYTNHEVKVESQQKLHNNPKKRAVVRAFHRDNVSACCILLILSPTDSPPRKTPPLAAKAYDYSPCQTANKGDLGRGSNLEILCCELELALSDEDVGSMLTSLGQ